ncbi:MAG: pyridoxal-dependent decarboxylase [Eubacteriales bacterium]|nr:pyridoxal-dependent decarboxylase [Eubacteriales bacterium]
MNEREYPTPYFVIDEEQLTKDFSLLTDSLQASWPNYRIGYSFKTNSLPWLVTFLKAKGVMAEVVSDDEYALANRLGFSDSEIVYNGPVKKKDSFVRSLLAGGIVNMDGQRELDWLEEVCRENPDRIIAVGVRVNFNLEQCCPGQTTMGEAGGRFGFAYENGVFAKVLKRVRAIPNARIAGLHLHSSSKTRSVAVFEAIASMACRLKREFDLELSYVDLGGGYCGGLPGRPQYPDYFPAVEKVLREEFSPEETALIVEPGISLLSKATTFVTGVVDVRDIGEERYLITDGSRFNIDPTMIKTSHLFHLELGPKNGRERRTLAHQCVSGFSCMEVDRIFEYGNGPELMSGDRIIYENVGGYTMSLNPLFIQYFPDVYIRREGELLRVRRRWTPSEYVQNCMMFGEEEKI